MKLAEFDKKKSWLTSITLLLIFCWANSAVAQDTDTDKWQFEATLYGWFTDIGGTVNHPGGVIPGGEFDIDVSDIIDNISFAFMGAFEARKNRWSIIADAVYLDVGDDKDTFVATGAGVSIPASVDLDRLKCIVNLAAP